MRIGPTRSEHSARPPALPTISSAWAKAGASPCASVLLRPTDPAPTLWCLKTPSQRVSWSLLPLKSQATGADFVQFDATARAVETVPTYGEVRTVDYSQLAGAYSARYGVGFELAVLRQHPLVRSGTLDLSAITHVRVTDVVGDGSELDHAGRPIHDPTPTFDSAGFDLDAVGALHPTP